MTIADYRRCVRAFLREDACLAVLDVDRAIEACPDSMEAAYLDHTPARDHALDCMLAWYVETAPPEKLLAIRAMLRTMQGRKD